MEQIAAILPLIAQILWLILLFLFILIACQLLRVLRDAANITKRIEVLTDIGGWIGLWKKFNKK